MILTSRDIEKGNELRYYWMMDLLVDFFEMFKRSNAKYLWLVANRKIDRICNEAELMSLGM